jgi:hypothetical protein
MAVVFRWSMVSVLRSLAVGKKWWLHDMDGWHISGRGVFEAVCPDVLVTFEGGRGREWCCLDAFLNCCYMELVYLSGTWVGSIFCRIGSEGIMFIEDRSDAFWGLGMEIRCEIDGQVLIGTERLCRRIANKELHGSGYFVVRRFYLFKIGCCSAVWWCLYYAKVSYSWLLSSSSVWVVLGKTSASPLCQLQPTVVWPLWWLPGSKSLWNSAQLKHADECNAKECWKSIGWVLMYVNVLKANSWCGAAESPFCVNSSASRHGRRFWDSRCRGGWGNMRGSRVWASKGRIGAGVGERWRVEEAFCQAWRRMGDSWHRRWSKGWVAISHFRTHIILWTLLAGGNV